MRDPERLLRRPSSALAGQLLAAGIDERPAAASLQRTLEVAAVSTAIGASLHSATAAAAALGTQSGLASIAGAAAVPGAAATAVAGAAASVGAAVSAGAALGAGVGASHATVSVTALAVVKWFGVGALGGVVAASAAHRFVPGSLELSSSRPAPAVAPVRAPVSGRAAATSTERSRQSQRPVVAPLSAPQPLTANIEPSAKTATVVRPQAGDKLRTAPVARATALTEPVLAAEVAFVDRGRAALQRGDGAGALNALAGYEASFPKRQLLPEVLFLRMEGCNRAGDHVQARALARRIVARGASGPQASRAREILAH